MHCLICPLWIPLQHLLNWGKKAPVRWTHCKWSRDPVALLHYPPMAFSIMTPKYRAREKTRLVFPNKNYGMAIEREREEIPVARLMMTMSELCSERLAPLGNNL